MKIKKNICYYCLVDKGTGMLVSNDIITTKQLNKTFLSQVFEYILNKNKKKGIITIAKEITDKYIKYTTTTKLQYSDHEIKNTGHIVAQRMNTIYQW